MGKKIEELNKEEAEKLFDNYVLLNKRIDVLKVNSRKERDKLNEEKKKIKENKKVKLKSLQASIGRAKTKNQKELYRKKKKNEAERYDRQIKVKETQIERVKKKIMDFNAKKAQNNYYKELVKRHLKNFKK